MRTRTFALLALAACAAPGIEEDTESGEGAVSGGEVSAAWEPIGYVAQREIGSAFGVDKPFCTATLIAKRVLVTAAHCFDAGDDRIVVGFGRYSSRARGLPAKVHIHPGYGPAKNLAFDLAYLVLGRDAPVAPMPITFAKHAGGCDYEVVGYGVFRKDYRIPSDGVISGGDTGRRTLATFCVDEEYTTERPSIRATSTSASACKGDSGGPLIHAPTGTLVGVTQSVGSRTCSAGVAAYFRPTALHEDFLREALAAR